MSPSTFAAKKLGGQQDKDLPQSTMFKENNIKLTCCTIIKMPSSRGIYYSIHHQRYDCHIIN